MTSTHQKSTFGASFRLTKYSSFMAASCNAIAVSKSSSLPVLQSGKTMTTVFEQIGRDWLTL